MAEETSFTADDLIRVIHEERDTPYPVELSNDALREVLYGVLDTVLHGDPIKAAAGLATLIDTIDNLGQAARRRPQ